MDVEAIKKKLGAVFGKTELDLVADLQRFAKLQAFAAEIPLIADVVIKAARWDPETASLAGQISGSNLAGTADLRFGLADGELHLALSVTCDEAWVFEGMPLPLTELRFDFSSFDTEIDGRAIERGVTFEAKLPASNLAVVKELLALPDVQLSGQLTFVDGLPQGELSAELSQPLALGPFAFDVDFGARLEVRTPSAPSDPPAFVETGFDLSATGGLTVDGKSLDLLPRALFHEFSEAVTFGVDLAAADLQALEALFGVDPASIPGYSSIEHLRLEFTVIPKGHELLSMTIAASTGEALPLVGSLALEDQAELELTVVDPAGPGRAAMFRAHGQLSLGSTARLDVTASLPDFSFAAAMPAGDVVALGELAELLTGGALRLPAEIAGLEFSALHLSASKAGGSFSIGGSVRTGWELIEGVLALERIDAQLDIVGVGQDIRTSGLISGVLDLVGQEVRLAASFDDEIEFTGELAPSDEGLSLLRLVEALLPGGAKLPDRLPDLVFSDLSVSFKPATATHTSSFSLSGTANAELGDFLDNPAVRITLSGSPKFDFAVGRERRRKDEAPAGLSLSLKAGLDRGDTVTFGTGFAWTRDGVGANEYREIQNDESPPPDDPIAVVVEATEKISITLVEIGMGDQDGSRFLKGFDLSQWDASLRILGNEISLLSDPGNPGKGTGSIKEGVEQRQKMPFLKRPADPAGPTLARGNGSTLASANGDGNGSGNGNPNGNGNGNGRAASAGGGSALSQYIQVRAPTAEDITFEDGVVEVAIPATIKVSTLEFDTELPLSFDLNTFAFKVSHPDGIKVMSKSEDLLAGRNNSLFGLEWKFLGAPVEQPGKDKRYHHFTLVTKDFDYQIQQAPGAMVEVAYSKATKEPIAFGVSNLAISAKGISLTAEVLDRPARLNGIDTAFRFAGSKLSIVDNKIKDLALKGSGPLPPKLVGDATADIALQFKQIEGNLTLVSGEAVLAGDKLLKCEGTRFQFQIDALGIKFVNDEENDTGFHLFFTLTGSARFVLAASDSKSGALAKLPTIQLELNECPLTSDVSVLAKHISFLVELPKPVTFPLLGAYEYELRAIGFIPQFEVFDNDAAMMISGQIKFGDGKGDVADSKPDYHKLWVGLPKKGSIVPRLHMDKLPLAINLGEAFKLNGVIEFFDGKDEKGFSGEGVLEIKGLPPIAASFGFFRLLRTEPDDWVRAWFIYIEARQISFRIPYLEIYLREIGLGFGYRYTLVGIKAAEEAADLRQLIAELKVLSRTQGDLAKRDRWARDVEERGLDPRWTIVLRAMFAQRSAAIAPLSWNQAKEEKIACAFLFDAVASFRSDLTFFMTMRGWINTSYGHFVKERNDGNTLAPLVSGFVLLAPREQRLLAHMASNPDGDLGNRPKMPAFAEAAIRNSQFSATLLMEPGLVHFELGWPNMLRWKSEVGPLSVERRGGFILRISETELVIGISYQERGRLDISAGIDLGLVGASLVARATLALGARLIAVIEYARAERPFVYGAIGLDMQVHVAIKLWIEIPLLFTSINLRFSFSFQVGFTAALEFGIDGESIGLRGKGTVSVKLMGHRLSFSCYLGFNESAITTARQVTEKFMHVGLEATDVETRLPGVDEGNGSTLAGGDGDERTLAAPGAEAAPDGPGIAGPAASGSGADGEATAAEESTDAGATADGRTQLVGTTDGDKEFEAPEYTVLAIRETEDDFSYFVLVPAAMKADGSAERGFLPVPPKPGTTVTDFVLTLPGLDGVELEHFDPGTDGWREVDSTTVPWSVDWNANVPSTPESHAIGDGEPVKPETMSLRDYLTQAFVTNGWAKGNASKNLADVYPTDDPEVQGDAESIEDDRVYNPSDDAFEAAVRGAVEQFRGSPFFKHDPDNSRYDELLGKAFDPETSALDRSGEISDDDPEAETKKSDSKATARKTEQVLGVRGLVIQSIVSDVQDYLDPKATLDTAESLPFQMGLVFRVRGELPAWLDDDDGTARVTIRQRRKRDQVEPPPDVENATPNSRPVRTFNVSRTAFGKNPPEFTQVVHYTDAGTIAIAWKLAWPDLGLGSDQGDPEHHLQHYLVRRRDLSGRSPETTYRVKTADVVHREGGTSYHLRPRFQIVDHFGDETTDELAALPATGRRYLYTIIPVDISGERGHPLTLVATRYPNEPPRVPVDARFEVLYRLESNSLQPDRIDQGEAARLLEPTARVTWSDPAEVRDGPRVAVAETWLVFRRAGTLPIGSYGLDSATQRQPADLLPTSNARALPSDRKVRLVNIGGRPRARTAAVPLRDLENAGVIPRFPRPENGGADEPPPLWRPNAWRLFIQTVSSNGVPSALAPVEACIRVRSPAIVSEDQAEERTPAELEWLPHPIMLPMLPPEDTRARTGEAHVPMPKPDGTGFDGSVGNVEYRAHPAGVRCIRLRWNQGPSTQASYPLNLTAGYEVLELDVDAHTQQTFEEPELLANAVRRIQEVEMLPAADLVLNPAATLTTNQWEAWYPSAVARVLAPDDRPQGSEAVYGPWYSWRDSELEWPAWPESGLEPEDAKWRRTRAHHPLLEEIIAALRGETTEDVRDGYRVDLQPLPPLQPQDFAGFVKSTAPDSDPYGWGVLQRFGLTATFSVRSRRDAALLVGDDLLKAVQAAIEAAAPGELAKHLFVELLFQPGRSIELDVVPVKETALLAIVQLGLRPTIRQILHYGKLGVRGAAGQRFTLEFEVTIPEGATGSPLSIIDQGQPADGQIDVEPEESGSTVAFKRTFTLPMTGSTTILMRGAALENTANLRIVQTDEEPLAFVPAAKAGATSLQWKPFDVTDPLSAYFTRSSQAVADQFVADSESWSQWLRFRAFAQSLDAEGVDEPGPRIELPGEQDAETLAKDALGDFLPWAQRFFDASAPPTEKPPATGWLATAYPRVQTPALAAPDEHGRLTYHHLLQDRWAHNYRYYLRPYDRYAYLWRGLLQSPALFPRPGSAAAARRDLSVSARSTATTARKTVASFAEIQPDPATGGLDIVLERTYPVDMPLILSSERLDADFAPGKPVPPGAIWEVIVAQHREQSLMERNQTVARRLGFRQVAFTLLRRFAFDGWIDKIAKAGGGTVALAHVQNDFPDEKVTDALGGYPAEPDHLPLGLQPLDENSARSLDLTTRLGGFEQGALVLQWEGLPFFYEHCLLLIAQTNSTVSAVNAVTQQDFEYLSPRPRATVTGRRDAANPEDNRIALELPLQRLWDALSPEAQQQWSAEQPLDDTATEAGRRPASLPDLEVVYQVVALYAGNLEVQVEYLFDEDEAKFVARQLGRLFLADDEVTLNPPATKQGDFSLGSVLTESTPIQVTREYDVDEVPGRTGDRVAFDGKKMTLTVSGVLSPTDRGRLLRQHLRASKKLASLMDRAGSGPLHHAALDGRESYSAAGQPPADIPETLADRLRYVVTIALLEAMTAQQLEQLVAAADPLAQDALRALAGAEPTTIITVPIAQASDLPASLEGKVEFTAVDRIEWTGPMSEQEYGELAAVLSVTAADLKNVLSEVEYTTTYDPRPKQPAASKRPKALTITARGSGWDLAWKGQVSATSLDKVWKLAAEPEYRTGVAELMAAVLSAQTAHVETLEAGQATGAATGKARQTLDAATARFHELAPAAAAKVAPRPPAGALKDTVFEARVVWGLTQAELDTALQQEVLTIRETAGGSPPQLAWRGVFDVDPDALRARLVDGLDGQRPGVQALMTAFDDLAEQVRTGSTDVEYTGAPAPLPAALALGPMLLEVVGPLGSAAVAELETMLGSKAADRVLQDLADRAVLDKTLQAWLFEEPVSKTVANPATLPAAAAVVEREDETFLQYRGHMTPADAGALRELFESAADRAAVQRLHDRSNRGRNGVELQIMCRRGSARPSDLYGLDGRPIG